MMTENDMVDLLKKNMRSNSKKCTASNETVLREWWRMHADSFVGIWKFVARPNLCEPPPA